MNTESEYTAWLEERRSTRPPDDLVNQIMARVHQTAVADLPALQEPDPPRQSKAWRFGPVFFWTVATLIFAIRIAALVGNLAFPTSSYPEFAGDQQIEEVPHDHRNTSRS